MYTEEIADEIVHRLEQGETLISICRVQRDKVTPQREGFPTWTTVSDWADPNNTSYRHEFSLRFARARLDQQRFWVEEIIDIANTPEVGVEEIYEHSAKDGVKLRRVRKDMLGHRALKIDARLKAVARLNPQLWAERLQQAALPQQTEEDKVVRVIIEGGLPEDEPPPISPPSQENQP